MENFDQEPFRRREYTGSMWANVASHREQTRDTTTYETTSCEAATRLLRQKRVVQRTNNHNAKRQPE